MHSKKRSPTKKIRKNKANSKRPHGALSRRKPTLRIFTKAAKTPRLLVVDNEIDVCNFVKSFFELRGFKVTTALNGQEGLDRLDKDKPDIVLLDIMMRTEREGLDFLPRYKEALPSARVLMITGVEDSAMIESAKACGADDYITKPLVLEYLENTVLNKVKQLGRKELDGRGHTNL